jgi:hypothetical protein
MRSWVTIRELVALLVSIALYLSSPPSADIVDGLEDLSRGLLDSKGISEVLTLHLFLSFAN